MTEIPADPPRVRLARIAALCAQTALLPVLLPLVLLGDTAAEVLTWLDVRP